MDKTVTIHTNLKADHQVEYANYLNTGFRKLGWQSEITGAKTSDAGLRVVQGPNYAFKENVGKPTILLDRCYWGDPRAFVTLAQLDGAGNKIYIDGAEHDRRKRKEVTRLDDWKTREQFAIVLNDYDIRVDTSLLGDRWALEIREHPFRKPGQCKLNEALARNDVAIGFSSSAMVSAICRGLPAVCFDKTSPIMPVSSLNVDKLTRPPREQWQANLSYMNWAAEEIASGVALDYLLCHWN